IARKIHAGGKPQGVGGDDLRQGWYHRVGGGRRAGALGQHDPSHIVQHRLAALIDPGRAHIDHSGLMIGIFLEADHAGGGTQRIAGIYGRPEAPVGIAQIGNCVQRDIRHAAPEDQMEDQHVVQRGARQFEPPGEFVGTGKRETRAGQRDVKRALPLAHRARRGVGNGLPDPEVFEEAAGIGLARAQPRASSSAMARARSTTRRAFSTCRFSTSLPSTTTMPLPSATAAAWAAMMRWADATSSLVGAKILLAISMVFGWIRVLPSKPRSWPW